MSASLVWHDTTYMLGDLSAHAAHYAKDSFAPWPLPKHQGCDQLVCWCMHRPTDGSMQPHTSSSAGLARVEVLSDRQAQSLQTLQRQLTKVQLKTRLMGHDVRPTLRKVRKPAVSSAVSG